MNENYEEDYIDDMYEYHRFCKNCGSVMNHYYESDDAYGGIYIREIWECPICEN